LHNNYDDGVLQRIADMRNTPAVEKVLQGMVMDLLRVLSAPDLEVRKRTLEIVMRYAALPLAIPVWQAPTVLPHWMILPPAWWLRW
jgi:hypothetical protein